MGSISGCVQARCKECKCRFWQHVDNWIFTDMEIVGTCDNCMNRISHSCTDEYQCDEHDRPIAIGRKEFKEVI